MRRNSKHLQLWMGTYQRLDIFHWKKRIGENVSEQLCNFLVSLQHTGPVEFSGNSKFNPFRRSSDRYDNRDFIAPGLQRSFGNILMISTKHPFFFFCIELCCRALLLRTSGNRSYISRLAFFDICFECIRQQRDWLSSARWLHTAWFGTAWLKSDMNLKNKDWLFYNSTLSSKAGAPWFEFLVIFDFFAPWYRESWQASSVKIS